MPETNEVLTAEEIKAQVSFPTLMGRYGYRIGRDKKMLCPFHQEKTGSFHVYDERGKCYGGCGWFGDVIQFVMDKESVYFGAALQLLTEWYGLTKGSASKDAASKEPVKVIPKKPYREPINPEIVEYFHKYLTKERRQWLYDKRLLTDQTINYYRIGWRPDMDAYSIPFWKGAPGHSAVETMQFRCAPKEGRRSRYIGLDGYTFPSLIGRHTMNPDILVVFIGTLDCVLANQDGIPAISPNGLTVWLNRLDELKWVVGNVSQLFFVPDNTTSETIESVRLANALGAKIRYLPEMPDYPDGKQRKDYTDYRLMGHTAKQFIEEVLRVDKPLFIKDSAHNQTAQDILDCVADGDGAKALELLEILQLNEYPGWSVSHKLMCLAAEWADTMPKKYWDELIHELEFERTYDGIGKILESMAKCRSLCKGDF